MSGEMALKAMLSLALAALAVAIDPQADKDQASLQSGTQAKSDSCPMKYHMGALLDVAEKACEAVKEVSACADQGKCDSRWSETPNFIRVFQHDAPEALWKVCCYRAYKIGGYQTCDNPNPTCKAAVETHVLSHAKGLGDWSIKLEQKKTRDASGELLTALNIILKRLQDARADMYAKAGACQSKLANPEPASKCGWGEHKKIDTAAGVANQEHSLQRDDLYCETIEWQYNEMGAADSFMKKCPGAKFRSRAQQASWDAKQNEEIKEDGVKPLQTRLMKAKWERVRQEYASMME